MSALGFVPDEVLVYILQAHDGRGAARQIARRCRKLVDSNFNVRYIRPPAGKFFIVDFEVNDNLAKDLYCAQVGERELSDGSSITGLVTFLHWLPAFCRSRVQRDVCHSLQESDGCALWKLISKVREHRETAIPMEASMNSKVGHLTVSEGQGGDARQVIGRLSTSETQMLLSVLDYRRNSHAQPLAAAA